MVVRVTTNKVLWWPRLFGGRIQAGSYDLYRNLDDGTGDGTECDGWGDGLGNGNWGKGGGSVGHYYKARHRRGRGL
jgi:hypothetical protein